MNISNNQEGRVSYFYHKIALIHDSSCKYAENAPTSFEIVI